MNPSNPEFTILMPCLNEADTLPLCIQEIQDYLISASLSAEILIADNGSTDDSPALAKALGARVINVSEKGYGNALLAGISAAKGRYIIMGDCDYSYDFSMLSPFVDALHDGCDLIIGNRFSCSMEPHAMPFLHRYFGVPFLSALARYRFHTTVHDFHCGLRGFPSDKIRALHLHCPGMEFATEMIAGFARTDSRIKEVPIHFRCDRRNGSSHLRTIRDGFRHLHYIFFGSKRT